MSDRDPAGSGTDASVVLTSVSRRFSPDVLGLDNVSLEFRTGEVTVLLGLSGSGKSTLLRHINGLQQPTSGQVTVLGRSMETATARQLRAARRDIGFIFQDFNLVGAMSVLENVCTGRLGSLRGPRLSLMSYPRQVRRDALEQLDRVGLADRAHQRADTLSGGQQQRVAIARALIQKPRILLADEPVASLDPRSAGQVIDLIARIAREEDLTVICSLHQVELALSFADRIVGLRTGQVVMDRRAAQIDASEALMIYEQVSAADLSSVRLARPASV
ncbi:phosphonate ABC transporter ATP-binding protein [Dietzia sp. E1]|uniref:phosphonate ABC transporter ATP-binding protein n=1 Tax=Dietzia sp. E1 TaxID=328361 RepID=UPI0015F7BB09|nr:phosphonate ABC transporter ATP-binding protein [Dietzia sp. E1]MBB1020048.1 phosphonate ABC transporter ATP-binding protein [Dietzia sp. E1]